MEKDPLAINKWQTQNKYFWYYDYFLEYILKQEETTIIRQLRAMNKNLNVKRKAKAQ